MFNMIEGEKDEEYIICDQRGWEQEKWKLDVGLGLSEVEGKGVVSLGDGESGGGEGIKVYKIKEEVENREEESGKMEGVGVGRNEKDEREIDYFSNLVSWLNVRMKEQDDEILGVCGVNGKGKGEGEKYVDMVKVVKD